MFIVTITLYTGASVEETYLSEREAYSVVADAANEPGVVRVTCPALGLDYPGPSAIDISAEINLPSR